MTASTGEDKTGRDLSGRGLEDRVTQLFVKAGCKAESRAKVKGARGNEKVDVLVELEPLGIPELWIVECKDRGTPVKRGDVQVLHKRLENVGASRGIMVSTSGYQSGCESVAEKTNILLVSAEQLEIKLNAEITSQRLQRLLVRAMGLLDRLHGLARQGKRRPGESLRHGLTIHLPRGPDSGDYLKRTGKLEFAKERIVEILAGRERYLVPGPWDESDQDGPYYEVVSTADEFCSVVEDLMDETESWADQLVPAV